MKKALILAAAVILLASLALSSAPASQAQKAEGKYAALCGEYSFDLSAYGTGTITAKFYVENDIFYTWASSDDSPDVLSPVEGKPNKFFIDDPDEGHWDFEFLKDDSGKYTKCRVVNEGMGVDAVGQRIGG